MHHANLPIEIIIKRYLWSRESLRNEEPLGTPTSPAYQNLAAPAPFAPSAYNIRCAKIGKSREGKEDGEGEKLQEDRRTNRTRGTANRRRKRKKGEYQRALVGRRSIPLMKYIVKFREGEEEGDGRLRDAVREGTVRKVAASKRNEQKRE